MSDDDAYPPGGPRWRSGGGDDRDPSELPAPSGFLRGVGVVVVAVIIGVLLLPSATRAPLAVTTASSPADDDDPTTTTAPSPRRPRWPTIVPGAASIHVLVVNGTSISGLAGGTATYLRSRGFPPSSTNATTKVTGTQVYEVSGPTSSATTVTEALGLPASTVQPPSAVPPVRARPGANVVVVAGPDLARLAPGATTTTAGAPPA